MAWEILDYSLNTAGDAANNDGSDLSVGTSANGLIVAAAFAKDDSLAGAISVDPTLGPIIPDITVLDVVSPLAVSLDTAVPYGLSTGQSQEAIAKMLGTYGRVISIVIPAIFARVAIFSPQNAGTATVRATAKDVVGANMVNRLAVKSYDANLSITDELSLKKLTYRISADQPIFDVWNDHTFAQIDVKKDDIVIWAASDTSPNADVASVDLTNAGVDLQNLMALLYPVTITNELGTFKVSSLVRVDRAKEDGTIKATFRDVTGAIGAVRLNPSVEIVHESAYPIIPQAQNLAYFQLHVSVNDRLVPSYPQWLLDLIRSQQGSGLLGQVGNWTREPLMVNNQGIAMLWNEIMIGSIDKALLDGNHIPFGAAEIFADRDAMEDRRELLNSQK